MRDLWDSIVLFLRFARLFVRARMQYRLNFAFLFVAIIANYTVTVLTIWIILRRFRVLRDWAMWEVWFLFGLMILSYGLCIFSFVGVREFTLLVQRGYLDKYLVRPRNVLFQVMTTALEPGALGHISLGITVLIVASNRLGLDWTPLALVQLCLVIAGATLIHMGLLLISAATCFWLVEGREVLDLVMTTAREWFVYPITVFDRWVQIVGTVVLPVSFITFFPAQNFLSPKESIFPAWFATISPLVGLAFFIAAYSIWAWSLRHYQGAGS